MRIKIVGVGEPVLRNTARPLRPGEIGSQRIRELIEHMRETLADAPGVGLAAPQIGDQNAHHPEGYEMPRSRAIIGRYWTESVLPPIDHDSTQLCCSQLYGHACPTASADISLRFGTASHHVAAAQRKFVFRVDLTQ